MGTRRIRVHKKQQKQNSTFFVRGAEKLLLDQLQISKPNTLENDYNKPCTKFGWPVMMGTCQNHVVKTTKAKNFILFSWRWEWATSKFCCKHLEELSNDRDSGRRPPFPPPPELRGKAADRAWEYISDKLRLWKTPFSTSFFKYFPISYTQKP